MLVSPIITALCSTAILPQQTANHSSPFNSLNTPSNLPQTHTSMSDNLAVHQVGLGYHQVHSGYHEIHSGYHEIHSDNHEMHSGYHEIHTDNHETHSGYHEADSSHIVTATIMPPVNLLASFQPHVGRQLAAPCYNESASTISGLYYADTPMLPLLIEYDSGEVTTCSGGVLFNPPFEACDTDGCYDTFITAAHCLRDISTVSVGGFYPTHAYFPSEDTIESDIGLLLFPVGELPNDLPCSQAADAINTPMQVKVGGFTAGDTECKSANYGAVFDGVAELDAVGTTSESLILDCAGFLNTDAAESGDSGGLLYTTSEDGIHTIFGLIKGGVTEPYDPDSFTRAVTITNQKLLKYAEEFDNKVPSISVNGNPVSFKSRDLDKGPQSSCGQTRLLSLCKNHGGTSQYETAITWLKYVGGVALGGTLGSLLLYGSLRYCAWKRNIENSADMGPLRLKGTSDAASDGASGGGDGSTGERV